MSKKDVARVPPETLMPNIDVFEKDDCLVTKIGLPGMKPENLTVEVADGYLAITGERMLDADEKEQDVCGWERQYFYRGVPLPPGAQLEDVKATFAEGVLEVSVPIPPKLTRKARKVEIQNSTKTAKAAA